jgi:hypothetical protein
MAKIGFPDIVGIGGIALTLILLVLDKAGKLKGGWLYVLLIGAGIMTLFIAIGNDWVVDAPPKWVVWRGLLMICLVGLTYSGLAIWIAPAQGKIEESTNHPSVTEQPPQQPQLEPEKLKPEKPKLPLTAPRAFSELEESKRRLESDPISLTLYDLFATDFSSSEVSYPHVWHLTSSSGSKIDVESIVIWQLETGIEFITFYIPYTNDTHDICVSWVARNYQSIMQDTHKMGAAQKRPGESEQTTAKQLVFSKRLYVYHETYLSPEEISDLRNGFQQLGVTILFRSTDYLANRKLEAKVKLLEGKPK